MDCFCSIILESAIVHPSTKSLSDESVFYVISLFFALETMSCRVLFGFSSQTLPNGICYSTLDILKLIKFNELSTVGWKPLFKNMFSNVIYVVLIGIGNSELLRCYLSAHRDLSFVPECDEKQRVLSFFVIDKICCSEQSFLFLSQSNLYALSSRYLIWILLI